MAAAQVTYWHFEAAVRRENERRQAELAEQGAAQVRAAADEAKRREAEAAAEAEAQLARAEQMAVRLEDVLQRTSATGARLRSDADEALSGFEEALSDVTQAYNTAAKGGGFLN